MRLLGIDYGSARIGVALGDTETRLASAWSVIENHGDAEAVTALINLAQKESVDAFVIGVPKPLGDQTRETDQAKTIRAFAERLSAAGAKVFEADETLSTALAKKQQVEQGGKHKRDDLAAAAILQMWLDRR
ncbi:MAG: Holliday junction resolvase RuvX [Patescibacteria group bacterium]